MINTVFSYLDSVFLYRHFRKILDRNKENKPNIQKRGAHPTAGVGLRGSEPRLAENALLPSYIVGVVQYGKQAEALLMMTWAYSVCSSRADWKGRLFNRKSE